MPGAFTDGAARKIKSTGLEMDNGQIAKSCTDRYGVTFATPKASPTLTDISGLPAAGAAHSVYTNLYVQSYSFQPASDSPGNKVLFVDVQYGVKAAESGSEGVTFFVEAKRIGNADVDIDLSFDAQTGAPILNSVGDPFDKTVKVSRSQTVLTLVRRESRLPTFVPGITKTVNSSAITVLGFTIPAEAGLIEISCEDTLNASDSRRNRYTYTITIRKHMVKLSSGGSPEDIGWDEAFIEQGYYFKNAEQVRVRFTEPQEDDEDKTRPSAAPCLLKDDGTDGRGIFPTIKRVKAYPKAAWSTLQLPTSW
jgi:hypothetical protein